MGLRLATLQNSQETNAGKTHGCSCHYIEQLIVNMVNFIFLGADKL
jgi:hypothetical protein